MESLLLLYPFSHKGKAMLVWVVPIQFRKKARLFAETLQVRTVWRRLNSPTWAFVAS